MLSRSLCSASVGRAFFFGSHATRLTGLLIFLVCAFHANAQSIIYVNDDATGANNGTSWANAYTDFQAAIDAASSGDQVWVAGGTYQPASGESFSMKKGVKIYGGFAGGETNYADRDLSAGHTSVLKGNDASVIFNNFSSTNPLTSTAVLDGFKITEGEANYGGGMHNLQSSPTISNCVFSGNNSTWQGGGMFNSQSSPIISNCIFSENTADHSGGGMQNYSNSSPEITDCTFSRNSSVTSGGAGMENDSNSSPRITNCTFSENTSEGIRNKNSSPTITNSTFSGNHAGLGNQSSSPEITNCTFSGNDREGIDNYGSSPSISNCAFSGNWAGIADGNSSHSVVTNCTFLENDWGTYNDESSPSFTGCTFSQNKLSGMFNGDSSPKVSNCTFLENQERGMKNVKSTPEITNCTFSKNILQGIWNQDSSPTLANSVIYGNTGGGIVNSDGDSNPEITYSLVQGMPADVVNHNLDGNIDPRFADAENGNYQLKSTSLLINRGNDDAVPPDITADLAGNIRIQKGAVDIGAYESAYSPLPTHPADGIIFVKEGGAGNQLGDSWANATPLFQEAINAASADDSVFVAGGEYQPAEKESFKMKEGVKIYGGFAGTETALSERDLSSGHTSILRGNGKSVIFNNFSSTNPLTRTAVLDGFEITGGAANNGAGMFNLYSSPTIAHCTISGNTAIEAGGGLYIDNASPIITHCTISGNIAGWFGGGVTTNKSSPTIINCIFFENDAPGGGGLCNVDSNPAVTNCVFSGNTSTSDFGGVYNFANSSPIITNTVIYGNTGNGISNEDAGSIADVTYSLVQGMPADDVKHNLDGTGGTDPQFEDAAGGDFRLQGTSPLINQGSNDAIPAGIATDLAGNVRVQHGAVDIGAYESAKPPVPKPSATGIIFVKEGGAGNRLGDSWANATDDFQLAINTAVAGNQVWVAGGEFQPAHRQSFSMKEGVKIYGSFAGTEDLLSERNLSSEPTSVLRGNGAQVILNNDNGLTNAAVLDGFKITEGYDYYDIGAGGMENYKASPTVANCTFSGNNGYNWGAGMLNASSSTIITNCTFLNNNSGRDGGGMMNDHATPTIANCTFSGNSADLGAGIYNAGSSPKIINCIFLENEAAVHGGGMYNSNSSSPIVINCIFSENSAGSLGGGTMNYQSSPTFVNCTLWKNSANNGGGMYSENSAPTITNCTISENSARKVGGALYNTVGSSPTITNSIIFDNTDGIYNKDMGSAPIITRSLVQGMPADADKGNLDGDTNPQFVDATNGDLRLKHTSAVIDAGDNDAVPDTITTDLAGNTRILFATVDLGAYENTNTPPALTAGTGDTEITYRENAAPLVINEGFDLTDDNDKLASTSFSFASGYEKEQDTLIFENTNTSTFGNIAASFDDATGTLTLTSSDMSATVAQWQAALRAVTYVNTSDNPTVADRVLSITVDDGGRTSTPLATTVKITAVNDAPVITFDQGGTTASIDTEENSAIVATITAADAEGDALTFSLSGGADKDFFAIDGTTGAISFKTAPDAEDKQDADEDNIYEVEVTVVDDNGGTDTQEISVKVTDVNDVVPIITADQSFFVNENSAAGTVVGTVVATDGDVTATSFQNWTITYGNDDNTFAINASTGVITVAPGAALDRETTAAYTLTLTVSDGVHTSATETVTITLKDVNDLAPAITANQSFELDENTTAGTVIGNVSATDDDVTATTFQAWTITSGNEDDAFAIDGSTGEITLAAGAAPDRETTAGYTLTLTVSDGVHTSAAETVMIALKDLNDVVPAITANQSFELDENSPAGTLVGTVVATDGDMTATTFENWTITAGNVDNAFVIDGSTGEITVAAGATLDRETTALYTLTLTVGDGVNTSAAETVSIALKDVNDNAPVAAADSYEVQEDTDLEIGAPGVLENDDDEDMNAALSAVVADPPAHGTLTLDADGSFTYHPEQDYAGPDTFTYQAGDGEQTSATTTVTLTIQAVNDAPVISSVEDIDLSMNTVADPIAFTVNDIDSDISGLAISATADNASLLPESGVALSGSGSDRTLILTPAADQTGSTQVTIRVSDGVVEVTEVFTLTVRSNPGLALKIPTAFTPNNDGVNDTWEIGNLEQHPDAVIHVFNRGGREVFSSTGYANPWDGTWNGKALPFGIYYFIVNLSDQASYKGTVMILD